MSVSRIIEDLERADRLDPEHDCCVIRVAMTVSPGLMGGAFAATDFVEASGTIISPECCTAVLSGAVPWATVGFSFGFFCTDFVENQRRVRAMIDAIHEAPAQNDVPAAQVMDDADGFVALPNGPGNR